MSSDRINCHNACGPFDNGFVSQKFVGLRVDFFFIALVKAVCASSTAVQPSHNGAGSCLCVAESQVVYHVGREESSSEE